MKTYSIKITGSGTPKQLESALAQVLRNLRDSISEGETDSLDGAVWEDPTILTEISEE